jgi:hypothetical protein
MEVITLAFMQRALIAAILTGLVAPAIGTYVVQRRLSLLGDGLGHVAIAGVGLALLTHTSPLPVAVVVCVAGPSGSSCCASVAGQPATWRWLCSSTEASRRAYSWQERPVRVPAPCRTTSSGL